jgi:hypothetical protein
MGLNMSSDSEVPNSTCGSGTCSITDAVNRWVVHRGMYDRMQAGGKSVAGKRSLKCAKAACYRGIIPMAVG